MALKRVQVSALPPDSEEGRRGLGRAIAEWRKLHQPNLRGFRNLGCGCCMQLLRFEAKQSTVDSLRAAILPYDPAPVVEVIQEPR